MIRGGGFIGGASGLLRLKKEGMGIIKRREAAKESREL